MSPTTDKVTREKVQILGTVWEQCNTTYTPRYLTKLTTSRYKLRLQNGPVFNGFLCREEVLCIVTPLID